MEEAKASKAVAPRKRKVKPVIVCELVENGDLRPIDSMKEYEHASVDAAIKDAQGTSGDLAGKKLVAVKVCAEFTLVANPAFKVVKG
jgi:hypothetical protein